MTWNSYELDRVAQRLVLDARNRHSKSLNASHDMRMTVPYGLERFWGEHLRLSNSNKLKKLSEKEKLEVAKSKYWKDTWDAFCGVMEKAGILLPKDTVDLKNAEASEKIKEISEKLWSLSIEDQRVAIAVLTQLCDCLVWWTQRYKIGKLDDASDS